MNEINCLIREKRSIDGKDYYIIYDVLSNEEFTIPVNQIETIKDVEINKVYSFLKEFNLKHNRNYFSIINPNYKIGEETEFEIINKIKINNRLYFELKSEFNFPLSIGAYSWQEDFKKIKCKIIGYKKGIPTLKNIDTTSIQWTIGEIKTFDIKGYSTFEDKKGNMSNCAILQLDKSNEITVKIERWHLESQWKFKNIKCKIIGILNNGNPKLIVFDDRHPLYRIGEIYNFFVKGFQTKRSFKGYDYKVIKLNNEFGDEFEVLAMHNQENKLARNEEIQCEIVNIDTRISLKQIKNIDPFFYEFDEIVESEELKKKYFASYLNDDDLFNLKLKFQYEEQSGFWVFTYCNHILTKIKKEVGIRKNLIEVINIIDLHTKIEKWVLSSGILKAINNDEERKITKRKTSQIIENNDFEILAIKSIINFQEKLFFETQLKSKNLRSIYYFFKYANFNDINEILFLKSIISIDKFDSSNVSLIRGFINYINKSIGVLKTSFQQDYFILSQNIDDNQKNKIKKYVNWIYIQYYLSKIICLEEEANILLSKFYRINTYLLTDINKNKKLLLNSFYIISNTDKYFEAQVEILDNEIVINFSKLEDNPNSGSIIDLSTEFYLSKITEKHYNGYKLIIGNTPGFLPSQNITDTELKYDNNSKINWDTNISITLYSHEFQYFIGKQLNLDSANYYSENKSFIDIKSGQIIYGIIKNTIIFESNSFGIFVKTEYGDGMIHQKYISKIDFEINELQLFFKKGDKIPVYVKEFKTNKLNLSLVHLIGTKYEKEYYDLFNYMDLYNYDDFSEEEDGYSFRIEIEKGYIFEQYALFQSLIEEKIKYIKFSKAFFSNTKNARSYLLNIYIEYFYSLQKLDELLLNYTFDKYNDFKDYIIKIREKIQIQTMENFPESKNLLFYIEILYFFNSRDEKDLQILFDLNIKSIRENDSILKAVAKTVLSNNLIISEINESEEESLNNFTLKNLKRIREYISQGVLSINETVEDKLEKELNEKRVYWKKMILEDEGEKLEFKATFKTPVPTNEKKRIIDSLEKQILIQNSEDAKKKIKEKIKDIIEQSKNVKDIEKKIIHSALKTICAFANTNGGYLLLGVSDDKNIFGLEQDYNSFNSDKNRDSFGKFFDAMLKDYFGESFSSSLLEKEFLKFPEGDILIVKVNKSLEEIFILKNEEGLKEQNLYIRNLSSSEKLIGIELSKFLKRRFREQYTNNLEVK